MEGWGETLVYATVRLRRTWAVDAIAEKEGTEGEDGVR